MKKEGKRPETSRAETGRAEYSRPEAIAPEAGRAETGRPGFRNSAARRGALALVMLTTVCLLLQPVSAELLDDGASGAPATYETQAAFGAAASSAMLETPEIVVPDPGESATELVELVEDPDESASELPQQEDSTELLPDPDENPDSDEAAPELLNSDESAPELLEPEADSEELLSTEEDPEEVSSGDEKVDYYPASLTVANVKEGIKLSWSKASSGAGYFVYRRTGSGAVKKIAEVAGRDTVTWTDTSVVNSSGTTYSYYVMIFTVNPSTGARSGVERVSPTRTILYLKTPLVTEVKNKGGSILVKWQRIPGAASYRIYRKTPTTGYEKIGYTVGEASISYGDANVKSGVEYCYTVRACKNNKLSDYYRNGKKLKRLTVPYVSRLDNNTAGIGVKWGAVKGASQYVIFRKEANYSWKQVGTVNGESTTYFTDTGIRTAYGKTFNYRVKAVSGTSESALESTGKSLYRLRPVVLSSLTNPSGATFKAVWAKLPDAAGYQLQYSEKSNFASYINVNIQSNATLSRLVGGLEKDRTYYVRIRGFRKSGDTYQYGVYSKIWSVKLDVITRMYNAYLSVGKKYFGGSNLVFAAIFDMDRNGIPEFIISRLNISSSLPFYDVYTFYNGQALKVGMMEENQLAAWNGGPGIVCSIPDAIFYYELHGNTLVEIEHCIVEMGPDGNLSDRWMHFVEKYWKNSTKIPSNQEIKYYSDLPAYLRKYL